MAYAHRQVAVHYPPALIEAGPHRRLVRPVLSEQRRPGHGVMRAFDARMVGGVPWARDADIDAQSDQPPMQARWEG